MPMLGDSYAWNASDTPRARPALVPTTLATRQRVDRRLNTFVRQVLAIGAGLAAIGVAMLVAKQLLPSAMPVAAEELRDSLGGGLLDGARLKPEPVERLAYLLSCVLAPVALVAGLWIMRRWLNLRQSLTHAALGCGFAALALVVVLFDKNPSSRGILWSSHPHFVVPALFLTLGVLAVLVATYRQRQSSRWSFLADGFAFLLCLLLASYHLSSGWFDAQATIDQEAIFFPVVAVMQGQTLLVDAPSLEGLYPHFLEPVFRVVGLSMASFSAVMALLLLVTLGAIYRFLRLTTPHLVFAWLGFAAFSFSPFTTLNADYPQYHCFPLRALFPALVLWLSARYAKRPGVGRFLALAVAGGLAPLWNLDSGLAALASALVFVGCQSLVADKSWREQLRIAVLRIALLVSVVVAVQGAFFGYLAFRSGSWPDLAAWFDWQFALQRIGLSLEPLPREGVWWLLVIVYLTGLTHGVSVWLQPELSRRAARAMAPQLVQLAALGGGLFVYYQGRSLIPNLYFAAWPAVLMLGLLLPHYARGIRAFPLFQCDGRLAIDQAIQVGRLLGVAFSLCLLISAMVLCNSRMGFSHPLLHFSHDHAAYARSWKIRTSWVNDSLPREQRQASVLVLSARDHLWHLHLQRTNPLSTAGFNQLLFQRQMDEIAQQIERQDTPCVIWDEEYLASPVAETSYRPLSPKERNRLRDLLDQHYDIAGRFSILGEKPTTIYVTRRDSQPLIAHQEKERRDTPTPLVR
jgi:hypothetical protein